MIRFIYGESGYGKTHRITELLAIDAQNGTHSFLIVPEQHAVASERLVLEKLPPSAQLGIEVLSFSRLYNRVCREYGGLEYNYITKPAKYLLMWKNLSELSPMLEHYSFSAGNDASLEEFMLKAVLEFKANGISSADLERVSEKLDETGELYGKLRDLSLIYASFEAAVAQSFSDSADNLSKLHAILGEHNFFEGSNVYVDSFTSFTSPEHKIIEKIFKQAKNATVAIPLTEPRYNAIYTASISDSESKLIENAERCGGYYTEILKENKRAKFPALAKLSRELWNIAKTPSNGAEADDSSVVLETCASPYAEAEAAARWSLELMRRGFRCRDIVVITRDAEKYRGIIEPAFERNRIPFFFSEKSDLCSKPSVKFLLSALRVKNGGWRASDVISHLKTYLYDIPQSSVDMFETYVGVWNIKGASFTDGPWTMNPDGYSSDMSERGKRILTAANEVREYLCSRLIPLFTKLDAAENAAESCRAIYEYLVECNIEKKLSELAARASARGNIKEAEEYSALYGITLEALALLSETLGEDELDTAELAKALKLVFDTTEIGTIPTSVDEVTIGSASTIRADNPRCVIVLGLREGEFPKNISDAGVLSSSEKNVLSELGLELSTSDTKVSDELLFVKKTFSLPSDKLVLITSSAETDGRGVQPSLPYARAKKLLPYLTEHRFDENDIGYLTCSPLSASARVFTQKGDIERETLCGALTALSDEFSYLNNDISPLELSVSKRRVSPEIIENIFPQTMRLSQSRLEKYVKCNFSYYCSYVLGLREEKRAEFRASDVGSFIHFILENLIKKLVDENGIKPVEHGELLKMTNAVVDEYIGAVCPAYERKSGRAAHLYARLRNLSLLLAENIIEEFSHSLFVPSHFELKIGGKDNSPPPLEFTLKDGTKVTMSGIVDRVDLFKRDERLYVRIVDYKTGTKDFSIEDLQLGLNTQMLIYLFTLCSKGAMDFFKQKDCPIPAGVLYLSSNIPTIELGDYTDTKEVLRQAKKSFVRSGLLLYDKEILNAMNNELSPEFLAGIKHNKNGDLSGKALTPIVKFAQISADIKETITEIAEDMKSGKADACPLVYKGSSPCDYCEMKPVCKITQNA
ncbi:MAG: exodeoxyribonuclease V subunit gamma [Clostridia bacterium]|nr:exodeoxyribonuclease V subunit gamma [Clostridia bacterium]